MAEILGYSGTNLQPLHIVIRFRFMDVQCIKSIPNSHITGINNCHLHRFPCYGTENRVLCNCVITKQDCENKDEILFHKIYFV